MENMQFIITEAVRHLQMQEYSDPSVTNAVKLLLSKSKAVCEIQADIGGFDTSLLKGDRIESEDALKEFKRLETRINNKLDNTKLGNELAKSFYKGTISKEAVELILRTNWKR